MNLQELQSFFKEQAPTIYRVQDGQIIEYKTLVVKGEPNVSDFYDDDTFSVGFNAPKGWKPKYALPFVSFFGIDKDDKFIVEEAKRKGGWDAPASFFWEDGDFFLTEEAARNFINGKS